MMKSAELERVRNSVLILAACIAGLVAMTLLMTGRLSVFSVVFLMLGFVFMATHWGLLSKFVECLGRGEKSMTTLWGIVVPFPLILALAIVYVACRVDLRMLLPSTVGILSIPLAGVCYGIYNGLIGCLRASGEKGLSS
jgi:hypothetical protein